MKKATQLLEKIYTDRTYAARISDRLFPTAISKAQGHFLKSVIELKNPQTILECGFGYGISSLWIVSGSSSFKQYHIVDPDKPSVSNSVIYNTLKSNKKIHFIEKMSSQQFLATLEQKKQKIDFIFIDADEKFDAVMADLYFSFRVIKIGGTIMIRNIWNPSVRKAVLFFIKNLPVRLVGFNFFEHLWVKSVPYFGTIYLRIKFKKYDLCVFELDSKDVRPWNHFKSF